MSTTSEGWKCPNCGASADDKSEPQDNPYRAKLLDDIAKLEAVVSRQSKATRDYFDNFIAVP